MFRPNLTVSHHVLTGRDMHARGTFADPVDLPIAIVRLQTKVEKTTVRADSSASRGSAEQEEPIGIILVPADRTVKRSDRIEIVGVTYEVVSTHPRWTVTGQLDHHEIGLGPAM